MIPIILGTDEMVYNSLPEDLQCYVPMIQKCPYNREKEGGKVGYLTINEGYIDNAQTMTQCRQGLHIESPGLFYNTSTTVCPTEYKHEQ